MSPMALKHHGYSRLEAGLLGTQQEEKVPFISSGSNQDKSASAHCPSEVQKHPGKMPPLKRVTMIIGVSLLVGLGLSLAKDPSLSTSCMRWAHGPHHVPTKMARTALNKRQDGSLTNATTSGSSTNQPGTAANPETTRPAVVVSPISSPPPVATAPSSPAIPPSLPPVPVMTPTSPATPQQPQPPSTSTTSTIAQAPPGTPNTATTPSQTETPTAPRRPENSGTSTTRHEPVSASSSSSSSASSTVVQVSPFSRSTKTEPSSIIDSTITSSHYAATATVPTTPSVLTAPTSEVIPTSIKLDKTITTGRVSTSSLVAEILTKTLDDGGTLTITSTSWVAVVPTGKTTSGSGPKLQNAAPKPKGHFKLVLAVGAATLGMLLF